MSLLKIFALILLGLGFTCYILALSSAKRNYPVPLDYDINEEVYA